MFSYKVEIGLNLNRQVYTGSDFTVASGTMHIPSLRLWYFYCGFVDQSIRRRNDKYPAFLLLTLNRQ